jgi:DNA-binding response OmpR family regulator
VTKPFRNTRAHPCGCTPFRGSPAFSHYHGQADPQSRREDGRGRGARVNLTSTEYRILEFLSLRKSVTLTKEMILHNLYGGMDEPEIKIIDVLICKLRRKLAAACNGEHYIETIWGRCYVLRDPVETAAA